MHLCVVEINFILGIIFSLDIIQQSGLGSSLFFREVLIVRKTSGHG